MGRKRIIETERWRGDEESTRLAVEVRVITSFNNWSDAFAKAADVMKRKRNAQALLLDTKVSQSAGVYQIKLYFIRKIGLEGKITL